MSSAPYPYDGEMIAKRLLAGTETPHRVHTLLCCFSITPPSLAQPSAYPTALERQTPKKLFTPAGPRSLQTHFDVRWRSQLQILEDLIIGHESTSQPFPFRGNKPVDIVVFHNLTFRMDHIILGQRLLTAIESCLTCFTRDDTAGSAPDRQDNAGPNGRRRRG